MLDINQKYQRRRGLLRQNTRDFPISIYKLNQFNFIFMGIIPKMGSGGGNHFNIERNK